MRLFENEKRKKVIIIHKRKLVSFFLVLLLLIVMFYAYYATCYYRRELIMLCEIKNKNVYTQCVNKGLSMALNEFDDDIVEIIYNNGVVSSVEYNTKTINKIRTKLIEYVINMIKNEKILCHKIYYSDFIKIPFFLNRGPSFTVNTYPIGSIQVECRTNFSEMGVNQTKNTIYFVVETDVFSGTYYSKQNNKLSCSIPIAETIIVGQVPDSFTNVTTDNEDVKDCVLNLQ